MAASDAVSLTRCVSGDGNSTSRGFHIGHVKLRCESVTRYQIGSAEARLDKQRQDWTSRGKTGQAEARLDKQRQDWISRGKTG